MPIKECCQAHYGLVVGSRYECMASKRHPGMFLMFKPNPDRPLMTMVVDCECPCHKGETPMAGKKKVEKKKVEPKKKAEPKVNKKRDDYLAGKIKVLVKENPKRKGSESFKRFELYTKHATVGEFLKAGGKQLDLNWDMEKGFINFKAFKSY